MPYCILNIHTASSILRYTQFVKYFSHDSSCKALSTLLRASIFKMRYHDIIRLHLQFSGYTVELAVVRSVRPRLQQTNTEVKIMNMNIFDILSYLSEISVTLWSIL
jgi:hypothetical protein